MCIYTASCLRNLWGRDIAQPPKYIITKAIYIILQHLFMHYNAQILYITISEEPVFSRRKMFQLPVTANSIKFFILIQPILMRHNLLQLVPSLQHSKMPKYNQAFYSDN